MSLRKPNPDYGKGAYRRKLHIHAGEREVRVALEDSNHAFRLSLSHDGRHVTDMAVDTVRFPFVTCREAAEPLRRLLGCPLDEDTAALRNRLVPGDNCTHLHDMALLALAHAGQPGTERLYEIFVADEQDGVTLARITCDGTVIHEWRIRDRAVVQPAALAGRPMMRGFYAWVAQTYSGLALEAAMALQRGFFVAQSRRMSNRPAVDNPATADMMPDGSCYSYNHTVVQRALRVEGSVWDLTDRPELLLQFRSQA
jgi:hypothetical protein